MHKLVLLRHGESQWNLENRFTGWTDVGLTLKGKNEAKASGKILKTNNFKFDRVYISLLKRARDTMELCLKEMSLKNINIQSSWRLNERHYGDLQGLNKLQTAKKYGDEQVKIWRRSYEIAPPPLNIEDKRHPRFNDKYQNLKSSDIPNSESLKDTVKRVMPLWNKSIGPNIQLNKKVLIVAHGNSLRALVKYLDSLTDKEIVKINIPTGIPLVYLLDTKLKPIRNYYIGDEKEINKKTSDIISQGKSKY
ncbi:2,3-diphosphoglycerate-dependent phosphoglycerate mutase [bacterium]|jgi:2,3-bisphosphoglycerate-dependent phosphoglycerate mutase|nr:2,3-diphosphoglycerate-dependent phosphoglycerate mutase [bacterium]